MNKKVTTDMRVRDIQNILHIIDNHKRPYMAALMRVGSLPEHSAGGLQMASQIYDEVCGYMDEVINGGKHND